MAKKSQKPGNKSDGKEIAGGKPDRASGGTSTGKPVVPPATGQRNPKEGQGRSEVF